MERKQPSALFLPSCTEQYEYLPSMTNYCCLFLFIYSVLHFTSFSLKTTRHKYLPCSNREGEHVAYLRRKRVTYALLPWDRGSAWHYKQSTRHERMHRRLQEQKTICSSAYFAALLLICNRLKFQSAWAFHWGVYSKCFYSFWTLKWILIGM